MVAVLPTFLSMTRVLSICCRIIETIIQLKLATLNYMLLAYSWHEMGVYDLPAMIDYVLAVSKQHSLHYIAHSMGCTMFFVLTSTLPHYNSKIRIMFGFGPAAFNSHMKNRLFRIAEFSKVGVSYKTLHNCE